MARDQVANEFRSAGIEQHGPERDAARAARARWPGEIEISESGVARARNGPVGEVDVRRPRGPEPITASDIQREIMAHDQSWIRIECLRDEGEPVSRRIIRLVRVEPQDDFALRSRFR